MCWVLGVGREPQETPESRPSPSFPLDPAVGAEPPGPGGAGDRSPDADGGERPQDRGAGRRRGCRGGEPPRADGTEGDLLPAGAEERRGVTSGRCEEPRLECGIPNTWDFLGCLFCCVAVWSAV